MWSASSFVIGLVLGMIIMVLIVWALYGTRTFIFSICPKRRSICRASDYFNDPGDALADGANINDILFLDADGDMLYKRVPKNSGCVPYGDSQTVKIKYPQHCAFTARDGNTYDTTNTEFGSKVYVLETSSGTSYTVLSSGSCGVESSDDNFVVSGRPLLEWDPNHLM